MKLQGAALIIALILCSIFLLLIICWLILYFVEGFREISYLKMEIKRASNKEELRRWKRKLFIARICLIPGVSSFFKEKEKKRKNQEINYK